LGAITFTYAIEIVSNSAQKKRQHGQPLLTVNNRAYLVCLLVFCEYRNPKEVIWVMALNGRINAIP